MDYAENAQAAPDGVLNNGKLIGYSVVIRSLNNGECDGSFEKGLRLLACLWEAAEKGWYRLSISEEVILWRWLVVAVFVIEQRNLHGHAEVLNSSGSTDRAVIYRGKKGGMCIYPGPERFCLANHIESVAIEKFGAENAPDKALQIYKQMIIAGPKGFELSGWGRDYFQILHDGFIDELNKNGVPEAPVMH